MLMSNIPITMQNIPIKHVLRDITHILAYPIMVLNNHKVISGLTKLLIVI